MELGSTAKLRTLAHYLEVMSTLHAELSPLDPEQLESRAGHARDRLTAWAADTLSRQPGLGLEAFLEEALDRRYSASPYETFFTGSGTMNFSNFDPEDNGRVLPLREAAAKSTNLVFIRLMRDLVRYHAARLPYDANAVLSDPENPLRRRMLVEAAESEARQVLYRAYRDLQSVPPEEIVSHVLGTRATSPPALASLYYAWHPGGDAAGLGRWLEAQGVTVEPELISRLERVFGNPRFTLLDYAYLLDRPALALWCAGERVRTPEAKWDEIVSHSADVQRLATSWLLDPGHRHAQNPRLRIRIEQDAFVAHDARLAAPRLPVRAARPVLRHGDRQLVGPSGGARGADGHHRQRWHAPPAAARVGAPLRRGDALQQRVRGPAGLRRAGDAGGGRAARCAACSRASSTTAPPAA